jgi:predicted ATP-grasp superfamily ATP-dependent carboligase
LYDERAFANLIYLSCKMTKKIRVYFMEQPDWEKWIRMVATDFEPFFGSSEQCHPADYDLVIPFTINASDYLNRHYPKYNGIKFLVSEPHVLATSNHKGRFALALDKLGLSNHSLQLPVDTATYPYVLKKAVSGFGIDAYVIQSVEQENAILTKVNPLDYVKQRWVGGSIEYANHLLFDGEKTLFHHSIEYQMPQGYYIKGRPTECLSMKSVDHGHFLSLFESILSGLKFKGICCFDYKVEEGEVKIFELNARYGGSLSTVIHRLIPIFYHHLQRNNQAVCF